MTLRETTLGLAAGALIMVSLGSGCGRDGDRVDHRRDLPREVRYILADTPGGMATATLAARGLLAGPLLDDGRYRDGRSPRPDVRDCIEIELAVRNDLRNRDVTIPVRDMRVRTNTGLSLGWQHVVSGRSEGGVLVVPPGRQDGVQVVFELPARHALDRVGEFRLAWETEVGRRTEKFETVFGAGFTPGDYGSKRHGDVCPYYCKSGQLRPPRREED